MFVAIPCPVHRIVHATLHQSQTLALNSWQRRSTDVSTSAALWAGVLCKAPAIRLPLPASPVAGSRSIPATELR